MSLINKMLQDLDKRNAIQDTPDAKNLKRQVRAVGSAGIGSEWFWRILAGLIFIALAWVGWVIWQLSPRPVVTELALRSVPPRPAQPNPTAPPIPNPAAEAAAAPAQPPPAAPEASVASQPASGLKLATELTPPPKPADSAQPRTRPPAGDSAKAAGTSKPPVAASDHLPGATAPLAPKPEASLPSSRAAAASGKIDKRESMTPKEQGEAEFRRGVAFVNQGRVSEGMDAFRAVLSHDPGNESARQTMVALLLEAKRLDEAARVLKEGLSVNPSNAQFAMLLARVTVEGGDAGGALAILDRHGASAAGSAEQRAFRGALLQRLGRHKEAVEEYRASVGVMPSAAQWWVGLGISQQALAQPKDALESFRRAKGAGSLTPELASFVDQRIRQLQ